MSALATVCEQGDALNATPWPTGVASYFIGDESRESGGEAGSSTVALFDDIAHIVDTKLYEFLPVLLKHLQAQRHPGSDAGCQVSPVVADKCMQVRPRACVGTTQTEATMEPKGDTLVQAD